MIESTQFEVVRPLGSGGMGVVYEAKDRQDGRTVALKTVLHTTGQSVYRIKQEFRALADIEHPNLVRLFSLNEENGQWFIAMERVPGVSFREYVGWAARTSATVPIRRTLARLMMAIRPHSCSASSRLWVARSTVFPWRPFRTS